MTNLRIKMSLTSVCAPSLILCWMALTVIFPLHLLQTCIEVHERTGTVFAYGQTASGKTHTMIGMCSSPSSSAFVSVDFSTGSEAEPGLVHLAAEHIMQTIRQTPDRLFMIKCSFLELYNEELRDILSGGCPSVRLRIHPKVRWQKACHCRSPSTFSRCRLVYLWRAHSAQP